MIYKNRVSGILKVALLALTLSFLSSGCSSKPATLRAEPKETQSSNSDIGKSDRAFKFEDYSTAESAQKTLTSMFPPGTPVQSLLRTLRPIDDCTASPPGEAKYIFCRYTEWKEGQSPGTFTLWAVVSFPDKQDKIKKIRVVRGRGEKFFSTTRKSLASDRKPSRTYEFRFEDYESNQKSSDAEVKDRLQDLFPKNTPVAEFTAFMRTLGAKCYGSFPGRDSPPVCRYDEKFSGFESFVMHTTWIVSFTVDPNNHLNIIEVKHVHMSL